MYNYIDYKTFLNDIEYIKIPETIQKYGDKNEQCLYNDFISLDTETSKNKDNSLGWLYQWCFSFPNYDDNRLLVFGRKPSQLAECLHLIQQYYNTSDTKELYIYVHNLSYDYNYIRDYITEEFGERGEILATNYHSLIQWKIKGLCFRCSYRLAGKSLAIWGKDLNIRSPKLVGEIDYNIERFQDSPLYRNDWRYMFRDIISLDQCIIGQMELWGDTLKSVPLTSTGYVRRETRKFFRKDKKNRKKFKSKELSPILYEFLKSEFAGALTHGNRFYRAKTIKGNIRHRDFASHYPSQQMCCRAPAEPFLLYYDSEECKERLRIRQLLGLSINYCFLAQITISNVEIKDGITLPYLQESKVKYNKTGNYHAISDNGRILYFDEGMSTIIVNEIDLKWIYKQYNFDYFISKVYISRAGKYPKFLRDAVNEFFFNKTKWKEEEKRLKIEGYPEDSPEVREAHTQLMIAKSLLNAIYGMCATDPVRLSFYDNAGNWSKEKITQEIIAEKLENFFKSRNSFLNYELGAWTTASARDELMEYVECIGYDNFIYADTDSIFYLSTPEIEERIEFLNRFNRECESAQYIEYNGKRVYFNQFEDENENITEFRFLHSKCYAYRTQDGELHCTIAGVSKYGRNGNTRVKELGDIEELKEEKTFYDCGSTKSKYVIGEVRTEEIDGHILELSSACIISENRKTLTSEIQQMEFDLLFNYDFMTMVEED